MNKGSRIDNFTFCRADYRSAMPAVTLALIISCVLWGCMTSPAPAVSDIEKTGAPEMKAADNMTTQLPGEIVIPQRAETDESAYDDSDSLYTLQMKDADVRDFMLALADQTGMNITLDPDVSGSVTVDLKKVTLDQALETVLSPLGLEYRKKRNLIKVYKPSLNTQIFYLNYINTTRTGKGRVSGYIGSAGTGRAGGEEPGGESGSGGFNSVSSIGTTDLWNEITSSLNSFKSDKGKIIINKAANSVVVIDYPENIKQIERYLNAIEGAVQRQVVIEASIIQVSLDKRFEAGINWSIIQNLPQMSNVQWGFASRGTTPYIGYQGSTGESDSDSGGDSGGETTPIPGNIMIRPFSGVFSIGKQGQSILMTDIVEALSTQGNVNILSKPRIATLNNQPAIIKVAREDVYFQTSRTTTFGETTTETNVNFLTVGIVLSVTPQISGDGIITMTIHPSITEKTGERTSIIGDSVPIIDVRETETVARVRNNQTVLIGGLLQDKVTENTLGLPILKDIPYLGKLFTHVNRETTKTELVIMLTPRIVNDEAMQSITAQEINKFDRLYKRSN